MKKIKGGVVHEFSRDNTSFKIQSTHAKRKEKLRICSAAVSEATTLLCKAGTVEDRARTPERWLELAGDADAVSSPAASGDWRTPAEVAPDV